MKSLISLIFSSIYHYPLSSKGMACFVALGSMVPAGVLPRSRRLVLPSCNSHCTIWRWSFAGLRPSCIRDSVANIILERLIPASVVASCAGSIHRAPSRRWDTASRTIMLSSSMIIRSMAEMFPIVKLRFLC